LNDTYNANPSSTELALKTLTLTKNGWTKIALLGDMLELGEESTSEHKQIIKIALEFSNYTYLYGDNYTQAYNELGLNLNNIKVFSDKIEMYNYAKEKIQPNTIILVKGSRGKKMEEISESIKKDFLD
jgi:UDP-N-acetylmuramoyl-tripeptide--D-alanyl-D-alanine ligase